MVSDNKAKGEHVPDNSGQAEAMGERLRIPGGILLHRIDPTLL